MIDAKIRSSDLRRVEGAIAALEKNTKRTAKDSVELMGILFSQSAAKGAKPGEKKRDIIPGSTNLKTGKAQRGTTWYIVKKRQGGKDQFLEAREQGFGGITLGSSLGRKATKSDANRDPRRVIENRGLAQRAWKFGGKKIGGGKFKGRAAPRPQGGISASKQVRVRKRLKAANPSITLINRLSYIERAYPGLVRSSLQKATNRAMKFAQKRLRRK